MLYKHIQWILFFFFCLFVFEKLSELEFLDKRIWFYDYYIVLGNIPESVPIYIATVYL